MKLLIFGPEERSETEIALLEGSKNYFESVRYVPITGIRIETSGGKSVPYYKNINLLEFDAVIGRIKRKHSDLGYVLLKLFEDNGCYTPNAYKSVLYSHNEFLTPIFLKAQGMPTPKIYFATSRKAIEQVLPDLKYPVMLRLPYDKRGSVFIDSYDSAKGVIDTLEQLSQPILIQEIYHKANSLDVLVAGKSIFCIKDKKEIYKPTHEEKYILRNAADLFEANLCGIKAIKSKENFVIIGLDICPPVDKYQKLFKEDVYSVFLADFKEAAERFKNPGPIGKFLKFLSPKK